MKATKVENHDNIIAAYTLGLLPTIGKRTANRIWQEHDLREAYLLCFRANFKNKPDWAKKIDTSLFLAAAATAKNTIDEHIKNNCSCLLIDSEFYPSAIGQIPDAPLVLFAKGVKQTFNFKNISIVGTRAPSTYGRQNAEISAQYFSEAGINIVSGFAYGIDIAAHLSAIKNGGTTTAILGSGLGNIYPALHKKYVNGILENGCFLSELPYKALPNRENFPERNRLVAAISKATLVVESTAKGGSLITAKMAFDYNKEVFVYPGEILNENYSGNHALIQRQFAQLATSPKYILEQLDWGSKSHQTQKININEVPEHLQKVYKNIINHKNCDIHYLQDTLNESFSTLQFQLTELELMGLIRSLPGNKFASN